MKNTKKEIVKVAKAMFMSKGYDNTSMQAIIDEVGIAKGTLYHHFSNKQAIMDYVLNDTLDTMILKAQKIASNERVDITTRIVMLLTKLSLDDDEEYLLQHIHKPENIKLNYYQNKLMLKKMTPILGDLIESGVKEKIFAVQQPYQLAEFIIIYITEAFDYNLNLSKTEEEEKISFFLMTLERLLGLKAGTFEEIINASKK